MRDSQRARQIDQLHSRSPSPSSTLLRLEHLSLASSNVLTNSQAFPSRNIIVASMNRGPSGNPPPGWVGANTSVS